MVRKMSRFQSLLIEFGSIDIKLNDIAEKYLGMNPRKANQKAARHELPFKTYRAYQSQKAPRLVSAVDLALYIDQREDQEEAEYEALEEARKEIS